MKKFFENDVSTCPWTIPVPLRLQSKKTFLKKHRLIKTDLSAMNKLIYNKSPTVAYCDLQNSAYGNVWRRLGSGRSVFYNGHYYKGIGRTPLAGNWNHAKDQYHGSGDMFASSAVREYFVSSYCKHHQINHLIVECDDFFLYPSKNGIEIGKEDYSKLNTIDRYNLGITIKSDDFIRHSNLIWMLNNLSFPNGKYTSGNFLHFLKFGLLGTHHRITCNYPADLVKLMDVKIFTALKSFGTFHEKGINWGSYSNNYTLDFRFLDLEVPTILSGPVMGTLHDHDKPTLSLDVMPIVFFLGFDFFEVAQEFRLFLDLMKNRLQYLVQQEMIFKNEIDFVKEFIHCLNTTFSKKHFLYSDQEIFNLMVKQYSKTYGIDLQDLFHDLGLYKVSNGKLFFKKKVLFRKQDDQRPNAEPFEKMNLFLLEEQSSRAMTHAKKAEDFNQTLITIDGLKSIDKIIDEIKNFEKRLSKHK